MPSLRQDPPYLGRACALVHVTSATPFMTETLSSNPAADVRAGLSDTVVMHTLARLLLS